MQPKNYEEWKHCITVSCGIPLTTKFVKKRIAALNDPSDFNTQKFIETWGPDYHSQIIDWFEIASRELP